MQVVDEHEMPGGVDVTVPPPSPMSVTVTLWVAMKLASTSLSLVIVTEHGELVHAFENAPNRESVAGVAISMITVPSGTNAAHAPVPTPAVTLHEMPPPMIEPPP